MTKRCYIAGAGDFCDDMLPEKDDFIIAADGGFAALEKHGITPDLVVGDFDSLGYEPAHPNILQSPREKDDTDMMLAVKQGLERGFKAFTINGGLGGRHDQTLANIQILAYLAENGARGTLIGIDECITAVKDGEIEIAPNTAINGIISVISHSDKSEGITLKGLKYTLDNATLSCSYPMGISNEFIGSNAKISVKSGTLIVIYPKQAQVADKE